MDACDCIPWILVLPPLDQESVNLNLPVKTYFHSDREFCDGHLNTAKFGIGQLRFRVDLLRTFL